MGCVSSKNDLHANLFHVTNVNEMGQRVSPGTIELTEGELVLYQGTQITRWPLRSLRRYGFDAEIFSFESGRRCTSGPGIYAFQCRRAESLFNLLQQYIQLRNLHDEHIIPSSLNDFPRFPLLPDQPPLPSSQAQQQQQRPVSTRLSRPGSLTSNGPLSPLAQPDVAAEHNNNNKRSAPAAGGPLAPIPLQHSYGNAAAPGAADVPPGTPLDSCHLYMNIPLGAGGGVFGGGELSPPPQAQPHLPSVTQPPGQPLPAVPPQVLQQSPPLQLPSQLQAPSLDDDARHCYANLEIETLRPASPVLPLHRKVNYIELDLDEAPQMAAVGALAAPSASAAPPAPDSPKRLLPPPNESYATIDYDRTKALSESVDPNKKLDNEGPRKTRHNSTIGELSGGGGAAARHSNSLSD